MKQRFALSSMFVFAGLAYGSFLILDSFSIVKSTVNHLPTEKKTFVYSLDSGKKVIDSAVYQNGYYYASKRFQTGQWLGIRSPYSIFPVMPMPVLTGKIEKMQLVKFHINENIILTAVNKENARVEEQLRAIAEQKKKQQAEQIFEMAMRSKGDTIHLADSLLRSQGFNGLVYAHQMGYTKKYQNQYLNKLNRLDSRIKFSSDSTVTYDWSFGDGTAIYERIDADRMYIPKAMYSSPASGSIRLTSDDLASSATYSLTTTSKGFATTKGAVKNKAVAAGAEGGSKSKLKSPTDGVSSDVTLSESRLKKEGAADKADGISKKVEDAKLAEDLKRAETMEAISREFPAARQLTAGVWNDIEHWTDFQKTHTNNGIANYQHRWGIKMTESQQHIRLKSNGKSIIDATASLYSNEGKLLWRAKTNNQGECVLFTDFRGELSEGGSVNSKPITAIAPKPMPSSTKTAAPKIYGKLVIEKGAYQYSDNKWPLKSVPGIIDLTLNDYKEHFQPMVDICMVVDATGSMGDEIQYLQSEMMDVITRAQSSAPCSKIRLSSVFYRDLGDNYVTMKKDFTSDIEELNNFLSGMSAGGGGDFPEAVDSALIVALEHLEWSENALARILFLVLDAPPHDYAALRIRNMIEKAAAMGIKIVPITASGINQETEFLMKYMAAATYGDYVYITNHSGIGSAHIAPTGVKENVDYLNDVMVNLIAKYCENSECDPNKNPNPLPEQKVEVFGDDEIQIQAYPNPAVSDLQIKSSIKLVSAALVSTTGQVVKLMENIQNTIAYLSVSDLKPGIYHIRCMMENGKVYTTKIIALPYGGNQNDQAIIKPVLDPNNFKQPGN